MSQFNILHVSIHGDDLADGSAEHPLRHISTAAEQAQPGDTVLVHAGIYRESIHPPRGGNSDQQRITFQAAEAETVEIRGSDSISNWICEGGSIWRSSVPNTFFGDFNPFADLIRGDWFKDLGRLHHTGAVYVEGHGLNEAASKDGIGLQEWFAEVGETETTFWIDIGEIDPNTVLTEVNARQCIFYPRETGCNYITVRGFTMRHAATNWAPPTAEQIGLIGTNWSKGWIIENNTISHSRCVGISLGKHGDKYDNTSADSAEGYVVTIERALASGWHRDTIGSHIVRNNHIHHCEQAGIVGSLGAIFSEISHNHIHHIHVLRKFSGEEQAGIKLHAAIDTRIENNQIHDTFRAIWLDWMTQGTRVSRNLCYHNAEEDLFVEVNHGPFTVDHNIFLSKVSLKNWSQGGTYVHNLLGGEIRSTAEPNRETPWHPAHDTAMLGLASIRGGDDRFMNNWITDPVGLERSCQSKRDALTGDWKIDPETNVFTVNPKSSEPYPTRSGGNVILPRPPKLIKKQESLFVEVELPEDAVRQGVKVSSESLGLSAVAKLPFLDPGGNPLRFTKDYNGHGREPTHPLSGPFAKIPVSSKVIFSL